MDLFWPSDQETNPAESTVDGTLVVACYAIDDDASAITLVESSVIALHINRFCTVN